MKIFVFHQIESQAQERYFSLYPRLFHTLFQKSWFRPRAITGNWEKEKWVVICLRTAYLCTRCIFTASSSSEAFLTLTLPPDLHRAQRVENTKRSKPFYSIVFKTACQYNNIIMQICYRFNNKNATQKLHFYNSIFIWKTINIKIIGRFDRSPAILVNW